MSAIYEIYRDQDGHFRFWLIAGSGKLLLTSKAYTRKRDCINAVASAKKYSAANRRFERRTTETGKGYFILKSDDNKALGKSRYFSSPDSLNLALEAVRKDGPQSPLNDLTISWH